MVRQSFKAGPFSQAAFPFILLVPAEPVLDTAARLQHPQHGKSVTGRIPPPLQEKQRSFQKYTLSSD